MVQDGSSQIKPGARNAVIVAHPDDESLWCGGLLARYAKDYDFDIVCCTVPVRDPERAIRFFDACKILGGYPRLIPYQESAAIDLVDHFDVVNLDYDVIFTHGHEGDYGHLHHMQLHHHVIINSGCTVYGTGGEVFHLTDEESSIKLKAIKAYNHTTQNGVKSDELLNRYGLDLLKMESFRKYK